MMTRNDAAACDQTEVHASNMQIERKSMSMSSSIRESDSIFEP